MDATSIVGLGSTRRFSGTTVMDLFALYFDYCSHNVVLVCCFMRIRIPRTKRQIDLIAAKRKMRNKSAKAVSDERSQAIVMNSMRPKSSTSSKPSTSKSAAATPSDEHPLVHKGSKQHTEV
ncbi:hypothetical protein OSTOST_08883 [Ostertagia ostertagi]